MNTKGMPSWMDPHAWHKFKQAEANVIRFIYGSGKHKRNRRVHYWCRIMNKWFDKVGI